MQPVLLKLRLCNLNGSNLRDIVTFKPGLMIHSAYRKPDAGSDIDKCSGDNEA